MEADWRGILLQWHLFFAIVSAIVAPALLFRKAALAKGRKGWPYFIIGLLVGWLITQVPRVALMQFQSFEFAQRYHNFYPILYLVIAYLLVYLSVLGFRRIIA